MPDWLRYGLTIMIEPSSLARSPCIEVLDQDMAAILRQKSSAERLEIAFGMWRFARDTIRRVVAIQHPEWTPEQISQETARRLLHDGSR